MKLLNIFESKKEMQQRIIKNIHASFDEAGDKLVLEANNILNHSFTESLKAKKELLNECGFVNTKLSTEISNLEEKISVGQLISQYSQVYNNFYKVITIDDIKEIGKKYKLCLGMASSYSEDVPEKNLKEIQSFINIVKKRNNSLTHIVNKKLLICAPKVDFSEKTQFFMENGQLIKLKDPIVLFPCDNNTNLESWSGRIYNKYFYIVSKWGLEASDPLVINEINN